MAASASPHGFRLTWTGKHCCCDGRLYVLTLFAACSLDFGKVSISICTSTRCVKAAAVVHVIKGVALVGVV